MRSFAILLLFFITAGVYAQTDKLALDSKNFIADRIQIYEPNPIHKEISVSIDSLFSAKLANFPANKLDTSFLIRLLLNNSVTSFEDSQEAYRYSTRRCMIFSVFAMSVQADKADFFLDLAEKSLLNSENRIDVTLADYYAGLLILDLLVMDSNKTLNSSDIQQKSDRFEKLESTIDKRIFNQRFSIIETYKQKGGK